MTIKELKMKLNKYPDDAMVTIPVNPLVNTATSTPISITYNEKTNELNIGFY